MSRVTGQNFKLMETEQLDLKTPASTFWRKGFC